MAATEPPHMKARYDHTPAGSPHDQPWRVAEASCPVPQLRLDDLQFVAVKITGKLEVVHVALVIDTAARHDRAAGFKPSAGHFAKLASGEAVSERRLCAN